MWAFPGRHTILSKIEGYYKKKITFIKTGYNKENW